MKTPRHLREEERRIVEFFINKLDTSSWGDLRIPSHVRTMSDGEMGSISFDLKEEKKIGSDLVQGEYYDKDGVLVLITLTVDKNNDLYELEFWKTDFSKLIEYPQPDKIKLTTTNHTTRQK
jgi:hypothetical protein